MSDNKLFYDIIGWHKFSGKSDFTTIKINEDEFVVATRKQFKHLLEFVNKPNPKLGYNSNYEADTTSVVIFYEDDTTYITESYRVHNNGYVLTNVERNKRIVNWLKNFFEEAGIEFAELKTPNPLGMLVRDKEGKLCDPFSNILDNLDWDTHETVSLGNDK